MATDPVSVGYAMLYGTLHGDATLMALITGVYQMSAPVGSAPDYCLLVSQAAPHTNTATGTRLLTRALFQVKVCGPEQDAANLRAAYARVDTLLQPNGSPLRNTGGTLACFAESELQVPFGIINGIQWVSIGGMYRVEV